MRKYLFFILLIPLLPAFDNPGNLIQWVVLPGSSLSVKGSTNINTFQCDIANYANPDTIVCLRQGKTLQLPMAGKLNLSIMDFDCHNKMMTNDLRKTLQAKTYPFLSIRFLSINGFPDFKKPKKIIGVVDISLAGVTKRYEINYTFSADSDQLLHLNGNREVHFSDFKLTPPSKMGGIIKAKDELGVSFTLHLKPHES